MKKTLVFLFSALLIVGMFVSCEANVQPKGTAIVKIDGETAFGKSLESSLEYADTANLDWYYTAKTVSNDFNCGQRTKLTKFTLGSNFEFSLGIWDFELKAFEKNADIASATAVYAGSLKGVKIEDGEEPMTITIPVTIQEGGLGTIKLDNVTITKIDGSTATVKANYAKVAGKEEPVPLTLGSGEIQVAPNSYEVKVYFKDADDLVKAEETITVSVYNGATTTISGFISETTQNGSINGEVVFTNVPTAVSKDTFKATVETAGEINVSRLTEVASFKNTKALEITAPVGTLFNGESTEVALEAGIVAVSNEEVSSEIKLEAAAFDNAKAFELTLNVSESNETLVEVAYAVGKNLNITNVYHNDAKLNKDVGTEEYYVYDPTTGILKLYLKHASYITILEGDTYYVSTLDELKTAMTEYAAKTIVLNSEILSDEIIVINKDLILDGNGFKITSTAARGINVETTGVVVIKNLEIAASGERAINVIKQPASLIIDNVEASSSNYTVNVAGSAPGAIVSITNSKLTGKNVVNVAAEKAKVTITDSTVNCDDDDTSANENYAALTINKAAPGSSIIATNTTITVTEGSDSEKGRIDIEDAVITINGTTDGVRRRVAVIDYGDYYADYETLKDAIAAAKDGETIILTHDIKMSEILVISKPVVIDGNGKKLTSTAGRAINVSGADADDVTIKNLTINCSGERGINVIQGATNITIMDSNITADNYAVNLAESAPGAIVSITNSTLTGKNSVNVAASGADVSVEGCTINCIDDSDNENYAALVLNKEAEGAKLVVTNSVINVEGDSQKAMNGAKGGTLTLDGSDEEVVVMVAVVVYDDSDYYYSFESRDDAEKFAAENGGTIIYLR